MIVNIPLADGRRAIIRRCLGRWEMKRMHSPVYRPYADYGVWPDHYCVVSAAVALRHLRRWHRAGRPVFAASN